MSKTTADFYAKDYTKKWPGLTLQRAKQIGDEIGVDWDEIDLGEFIQGIKEEMEHGSMYGDVTQVHADDYVVSAKIAVAHLKEVPNYYTLLEEMEHKGDELFPDDEAKKAWVRKMREQFAREWQEASA